MATRSATSEFHHFDDCKMSGCPGHTMRVEHQTTSDAFTVWIDDEIVFSGDDTVTRTMLKLIAETDYR